MVSKTSHPSKRLLGPWYANQCAHQHHREVEGRYHLAYQNTYEKTSIPSIGLGKDVAPLSQFRADVTLGLQQARNQGVIRVRPRRGVRPGPGPYASLGGSPS
jgi:hypothetical protein